MLKEMPRFQLRSAVSPPMRDTLCYVMVITVPFFILVKSMNGYILDIPFFSNLQLVPATVGPKRSSSRALLFQLRNSIK